MSAPRDTGAAAEGFGQLRLAVIHGRQRLKPAHHEHRALLVRQDRRLLGRKRELAARRVIGDEPARGLRDSHSRTLALVRTCTAGQLARRRGAVLGQGLVQTELVSDDDQRGIRRRTQFVDHRAQQGLEFLRLKGFFWEQLTWLGTSDNGVDASRRVGTQLRN